MRPINVTLGVIVTVFSLLGGGGLWGAWKVFDKANAWAADVKRTQQQFINDANAEILEVKWQNAKAEVYRLRTLEAEREANGGALTVTEQLDLEIATVKRNNLAKTLLKLGKIKLESEAAE